jgi:uncharacterized protein DUF4383/short repeat uncharacterized protein DUF308
MAKTVATVVGVVFILVGIAGFFSPHLMGANLGKLHNVIHLVSGALSLYIGTKGSLASAKQFCLIFGVVYALLGVVGFVAGTGPEHHLGITQYLNLMTVDHVIHIAIGALFVIGGIATKSSASAAA